MNRIFRAFIYSSTAKFILHGFFSLFYEKKYLTGINFDQKRMGYYWALRGLRGKIFGENRSVPWPVHPRTIISGSDNITFDQSSLNVFQTPGCYWQCFSGQIIIGKNCHVAPNVGVITTNHDTSNPKRHAAGKTIIIGDNCWIGMNSMILPGVCLGEGTVVGAGAVVTRSFMDGQCVLGGVPAVFIKPTESRGPIDDKE